MTGVIPMSEADVNGLLEAIYQRFHQDFRRYAMASLKRRISAALIRMNCGSIGELMERLSAEPELFDRLLQHMTVHFSDMFREPSFFATFRQRIVPELKTYPSLKLWVAGCSTGEEVYSFAIILREEGLLERTQIYATDISPSALRAAEAGVYPIDRLAAFSEGHKLTGARCALSEHYSVFGEEAIFSRALAARVVFSDHSLATDNVFAEMQVVSCRNVLIYFDRTLQNRALGLFRETLCRRGFLGLGSGETVRFSEHSAAFQDYAAADRWYQRC